MHIHKQSYAHAEAHCVLSLPSFATTPMHKCIQSLVHAINENLWLAPMHGIMCPHICTSCMSLLLASTPGRQPESSWLCLFSHYVV